MLTSQLDLKSDAMTGKDRVRKAIEFDHPDRLPVYAEEETDIVRLSYVDPAGWTPRGRRHGDFEDEWRSVWRTDDETMGSVERPAIGHIDKAERYVFPDPHLPARWDHFDTLARKHRDHYIVGNAQYLCFDRLTFLLGEVAALEGLLIHTEKIERLMDRIIDFELGIVDELADRGVDGVRFWDDVGAAHGVIMGPRTWRALFKARYERVFARIRQRGLHVHWHSCGNCMDIMEDLIEIGAQVFSIGEPFMMGVERLAERFAGRACFECSPDNRSILSKGNKEQIETAVERLVSHFSAPAGGLILIAAPDNFDCVPVETRRIATDAVLRACERPRSYSESRSIGKEGENPVA